MKREIDRFAHPYSTVITATLFTERIDSEWLRRCQ